MNRMKSYEIPWEHPSHHLGDEQVTTPVKGAIDPFQLPRSTGSGLVSPRGGLARHRPAFGRGPMWRPGGHPYSLSMVLSCLVHKCVRYIPWGITAWLYQSVKHHPIL